MEYLNSLKYIVNNFEWWGQKNLHTKKFYDCQNSKGFLQQRLHKASFFGAGGTKWQNIYNEVASI